MKAQDVISQDTPWSQIHRLMLPAYGETWLMVGIVMLFVVSLGGLLGVVLFNTSARGLFSHPAAHRSLSWLVNIGRSLPFLVLMAAIIPFTFWLTGTTIFCPAGGERAARAAGGSDGGRAGVRRFALANHLRRAAQ